MRLGKPSCIMNYFTTLIYKSSTLLISCHVHVGQVADNDTSRTCAKHTLTVSITSSGQKHIRHTCPMFHVIHALNFALNCLKRLCSKPHLVATKALMMMKPHALYYKNTAREYYK